MKLAASAKRAVLKHADWHQEIRYHICDSVTLEMLTFKTGGLVRATALHQRVGRLAEEGTCRRQGT